MRQLQVIFVGYVSSEKFNKYSAGYTSGRFPFIIFLGGRAYNFARGLCLRMYVVVPRRYIPPAAPTSNIVFVHFKSAAPLNIHGTTVSGNLLFDIRVYSPQPFINWDFVAN